MAFMFTKSWKFFVNKQTTTTTTSLWGTLMAKYGFSWRSQTSRQQRMISYVVINMCYNLSVSTFLLWPFTLSLQYLLYIDQSTCQKKTSRLAKVSFTTNSHKTELTKYWTFSKQWYIGRCLRKSMLQMNIIKSKSPTPVKLSSNMSR